MTRPARITFLVDRLARAVEVANTLSSADAVMRRTSPKTRIAREYALAVKGRLLGHAGGQRPLEPWFARPAYFDPSGTSPSGDWDAAMVAFMRESGRAGFLNRSQRRHWFPRVQRIDGEW